MEENVFTDIEGTLKAVLAARVRLDGHGLPVRIVTPDPDFVELELPCVTLQLADVRRDPTRKDNERRVEKDIEAMEATVRPPSEPYDLHFSVGVHGEQTRDARLMLEQVLLLLAEQPALTTQTFGRRAYLAPDASFRDLSKSRNLTHTVGIVVKTHLEPGEAEVVPLAREHVAAAKAI
ncbi:MAG: tail sheath stabilizer and completion protein [Planctomycetota bacterium]